MNMMSALSFVFLIAKKGNKNTAKSCPMLSAVRMRMNVCIGLARNVSFPPSFTILTLMNLFSLFFYSQIGG